MFDLESIKAMNDRFAEHKAREALRRGSKKQQIKTKPVKVSPEFLPAHSVP